MCTGGTNTQHGLHAIAHFTFPLKSASCTSQRTLQTKNLPSPPSQTKLETLMGTSQVLGLRPSLHDKFLPKSWIYDSFFFAMHSGLSHSSPLVLQESGHVSLNREVPEAAACSDRGWASAQAQRLLRWLPKCTELVPPQPDCKPGPHPSKMPSPQR